MLICHNDLHLVGFNCQSLVKRNTCASDDYSEKATMISLLLCLIFNKAEYFTESQLRSIHDGADSERFSIFEIRPMVSG